jgi:hypothetical protein
VVLEAGAKPRLGYQHSHLLFLSPFALSTAELPQFPHTSTPATSSIFKKLSRPLFIGGVGIASFAASYGKPPHL